MKTIRAQLDKLFANDGLTAEEFRQIAEHAASYANVMEFAADDYDFDTPDPECAPDCVRLPILEDRHAA